MEPPTDTPSAQVAHLQAELDDLRARYDALLEAKNRAAERYKADYKKWRDFKRWLFQNVETDDPVKSVVKSGQLVASMKASALGKRKQFEDYGPLLDTPPKRESFTIDLPHSPLVGSSRHQRRKSYHGESSNKLSSSSGSNKDPFLSDDTSLVLDHIQELPCKAESSQSIPLTEPRKGRGRYAQTSSGISTINSKFSIRKDRNNGLDFQYDAVVRNRQERKHMLGSDCECCHEYYEAVAPLPPSRHPVWRTPTKRKSPHNFHAPNDDKENTDEVEEHKQLISRHRHHWHRPKTPPGYWDIGFPDTQEVLDINRRAAEMHRRKLVEVESEAMNTNGRYTKRTPRTP